MSLLGLPNELLDPIFHKVVASIGVHRAWKLRAVCRVFARHIHDDVLGQWHRRILKPHRADRQTLIGEYKTFVLCRRSARILDANPFLPRRINAMNDWMYNTLKEDGDTDTKRYIGTLCETVTSRLGAYQFIRFLYPSDYRQFDKSNNEPEGVISTADKLAVAVCLPEYLAKKLIYPAAASTSLLENVRFLEAPAYAFGDMLYNAILTHLTDVHNGTAILGSSWALDMLETYLREAKHDPSSNYASFVSHLQHSSFIPFLSHREPPLTHGAIGNALSLSMGQIDNIAPSPKILQRLFDLFNEHCQPLNKPSYNKWLDYTIRSGNQDIVRLTLAWPGRTLTYISLSRFALACSVNAEVVRELLRSSGLSVNAYYKTTSLLMIALRKGTPEVVEAVLEAGADVDARRLRVAPLHVALRQMDVMKVKLLLDRDVKVISVVGKRELAIINRYKQVITAVSTVPAGGDNDMMFRFMSGRIEMRQDRGLRSGALNGGEWHRADSLEDLAVRQLQDLFDY